MKAIRVQQFGAPEVLRVEEIPQPVPGDNQLLVRVHAAGVNPVDTYIRSGNYAAKPALPYTPGADGAGVVEVVGKGITQIKKGDRVYIAGSVSGTYAEYALCEATQVFPLAEQVTFQQGAAINVPYATAYRALFQRAKAVAGETILVHGATGGVGLASVQLAVAAGMTVIGTGGTQAGRDLVKTQGAQQVADHKAPDYLKQILDWTAGRGVDVVLEMAAHFNLGKVLSVLAREGRVAVIGSRGPVEINPRDLMSRDAVIFGVMLGNANPKDRAGIYAALGAGLANKSLNPVVAKQLPLADAPAAHEAVMQSGALGKIVLVP